MFVILTFLLGLLVYAAFKSLATSFYTVRPDERAVLTSFNPHPRR
jgi:regulator of protease activity HflC (stomatin/prohibitin superfamily)